MKPIRAVLFDFGGVLAEEGFRAGLHAIAELNGHDPDALYAAGVDTVYASGYVVGRCGEADFWNAVRRRFALKQDDAKLSQIVLDHFVLRAGMIELVRMLRARGLICAILSDQTDWLERLDARDQFFCEFDRVYYSYRLGKSKRDATVFAEVLGDLRTHPDQAVFLDDDADNVQRARSRGLRAVLCGETARCRRELQQLLSFDHEGRSARSCSFSSTTRSG